MLFLKQEVVMKLRVMVLAIFFAMMVSFTGESKAQIAGGWVVCEIVRVGVNAEHGYAYLDLRNSAWVDPAAPAGDIRREGRVIFFIDESIRKESIAVALTALSLGEPVRVLVRAGTNPNGYQVLKAVYTYTP